MGRIVAFAAVCMMLGTATSAAREIRLESGAILTIDLTAHARNLPHAYYDQAISSLPHLFPQHVILASRRTGVLGEVVYALVCYKESASSVRVVIEGMAVHGNRAWKFDAIAPAAFSDTLVQVLEQVAKLSLTDGAQRPPPAGPAR